MLAGRAHHLGLQLFLRSRGSALTVTPEADAFFYEVERSFSGIAALKRVAEDIRNMATGTLRIAALPPLAVSFLPRVIEAFRETHPGVTLQIQTPSSASVRRWMGDKDFSCGPAATSGEFIGRG